MFENLHMAFAYLCFEHISQSQNFTHIIHFSSQNEKTINSLTPAGP